ncbi:MULTISPECIES: hypothetical protein [Streptomyces]|uniref:hypothetical protein n=1 Tax=Streptomyces TaxID=1883 RepID=UPI0034061208
MPVIMWLSKPMSPERVRACHSIISHSVPDARQALQVVRWKRELSTGKLTIERVYLITSLPPGQATGARARWLDQGPLGHRKPPAPRP